MEETYLVSSSLSLENPEQKEHGLESQGMETGSTEYMHACSGSDVPLRPTEARPNPKKLDTKKAAVKNSRRLSRFGKKVVMRNGGKTYLLRSSFSNNRVLRSRPKAADEAQPPLNNNPVSGVKEKKKRRKNIQRTLHDEFSNIRKSVRYLLHRMSYEQSLIDAYAGEGWKGQSSEKIKPEMELQRAKSEILRCKSKIRNLFQRLDSSIYEGKLDDSLFDSEGEICSEDIFCAKCRSKDASVDNDIILCDGICDRGFHQKCLNPPLLKDDIPSGDEGWLCPGCDCKVDCLDLINEKQGIDLSIDDEWEKVFPEAAASLTCMNGQHDDLELPSDDSEDHDYDPDSLKTDEELMEGSSSDESDFTSASEDSGVANQDLHDQNFGFPSDDSEDNDYDPDKPDLDEKAGEGSLNSDESDFTSDTDDLNFPYNDASDLNEAAASPVSKYPQPSIHPGQVSDTGATDKLSANSVPCSLESELGQESVVTLSGKRQRERLDYKKLYDEAYGNNSSDSSDDEEWTEMSTPKDLNCDSALNDTEGLMKNETIENQKSSKRIRGRLDLPKKITESPPSRRKITSVKNENHQKGKTCREVQKGPANCSVQDFDELESGEKQTPRCSRKFSALVFQKLQESFRENQYPNRNTKENLAKELGITAQQVSKWFENARHSFRVSAKEASPAGPSSVTATCGATSKRNINIHEDTCSKRPNEGHPLTLLGESHLVDVSETQNGKNGSAKMKVIGEATSREVLVIRELRKRRIRK